MQTKPRTARSVPLGRRVRGGAGMPCAFPIRAYHHTASLFVLHCLKRDQAQGEFIQKLLYGQDVAPGSTSPRYQAQTQT